MANCKREVVSFKNRRIIKKPFDEWVIIEDTHTPIVSKDVWLEAQKLCKGNDRKTVRRSSNGEVSIFAGVVTCAVCGANMVYNNKIRKKGAKEFFRCSTYTQKGKDVCPMHCVDYDLICQVVLADIQQHAILAVEDEQRLIDRILKSHDEFKAKNLSRYERSIREAKNRIREIDGLLQNLYEDKINGEVPADIFKRMSQKYGEEQNKLLSDVEQMERELDECKRVQQDLNGWIKRIKECLTIDSLNRVVVVELIDNVEVSEIYNVDGEMNLDVSISYKFGRLTKAKEPVGIDRARFPFQKALA
jgi:hypothetical protein